MYSIPESHILQTWALETLVKKIKNGFDFELLKRGVKSNENENDDEEKRKKPLTTAAAAELIRLYQ